MIDFLLNQLLAKVGIAFDPNAHPATNIAGVMTQMTGNTVEPFTIVEAFDKAAHVVSEISTVDKAALSNLFSELRPVVEEIDPVKVAALLRAAVHHFGVVKDERQIGPVAVGSSGAAASGGTH